MKAAPPRDDIRCSNVVLVIFLNSSAQAHSRYLGVNFSGTDFTEETKEFENRRWNDVIKRIFSACRAYVVRVDHTVFGRPVLTFACELHSP